METHPLLNHDYQSAVAHGFMALFGAIVNASRAHRAGKSKGVLDFFILTLMSSFSGIVFALVAIQFFDNQYMTIAVTGAGGFLGVEGLTILTTKLRDALTSVIK